MSLERGQAQRLVLFNHKGGVGKTTLIANLAMTIASQGHRVLLVDSDPQANLTSYLVSDDVVDDLLDKSDSEEGQTIWSALRPVSEGTGAVKRIRPIELRDRLYLIPGDVRLSEFELELNDFWGQCLQRRIRGFLGTTALSQLVSQISTGLSVEFVFYDAGPNIGPLNRAILLDSDFLVIPVAADLFSVRALKTLGRSLERWVREWQTISELAPEGTYLFPGRPQFLGYIPQSYRVYRGLPAARYSRYLSRIERAINDDIISVLRKADSSLAPRSLGEYALGATAVEGKAGGAAR